LEKGEVYCYLSGWAKRAIGSAGAVEVPTLASMTLEQWLDQLSGSRN